jgi:hypothetical protein
MRLLGAKKMCLKQDQCKPLTHQKTIKRHLNFIFTNPKMIFFFKNPLKVDQSLSLTCSMTVIFFRPFNVNDLLIHPLSAKLVMILK